MVVVTGTVVGGSGVSGILYNGGSTGTYTINGTGYVTAGTGHSMNINTYAGTLVISAPIIDGAGQTFDVLNKEGNGTLILTGNNAYGASATATDFVVFSGLHWLGASAGQATFFGCVAGGVVAFSLSRRWTFQAGSGRALPQILPRTDP